MYRRASKLRGGKPLYGWSTGGYTKPNECDDVPHLTKAERKENRKKKMDTPTGEELEKLMSEYYKRTENEP